MAEGGMLVLSIDNWRFPGTALDFGRNYDELCLFRVEFKAVVPEEVAD